MSPGRKALFALAPLALLLVVGELGARLLGAEECEAIVPQATGWETMVGDARYLWRLQPDREFTSPSGTTRINAVGLRTELLPDDPKADDEIRVMITGDSSVFGWGQADGQTYADQLEAELNRNFGRGRFEVVNLGVPGYSTEQTLRLLDDLGWRYQPDLLVVHNIFSDCNIDAFQDRAALALADPDGTPLRALLHDSRLYCAAWMPWARFQATLNQQPNRVLMPGMPTGPNAATTLEKIDTVIDLSRVPLDDYLDNLDEIRTQAEEHGASMILAPLAQEWDLGIWTMPMDEPKPGQVLPWHPYRQAQAEWAQARGIGRVYLPDAFAQASGDKTGLFFDQMHPSERGAQVMAWAVVDHLRDNPQLVGLAPADVLPLPERTPLPTRKIHRGASPGQGQGPGGGIGPGGLPTQPQGGPPPGAPQHPPPQGVVPQGQPQRPADRSP